MTSVLARLVEAASKKRKERDQAIADGFKPPPQRTKPNVEPVKPVAIQSALPGKNRLLAGYVAREFLTKGTIFGSPVDPKRPRPDKEVENGAFADVARLVMHDGAHISGVVNPTQLGCWIRKGTV